jgi:ribonuclease G
MESDREHVLERALPFREGEEVHVEIVEPHMYSPGDAVAKVDGYIISVKDATSAVGEKRLVRIEEVGRTSAVARLIDVPTGAASAPNGDGPEENDDDVLESTKRRRGRRGGRRRSTTEADATAAAGPSSSRD